MDEKSIDFFLGSTDQTCVNKLVIIMLLTNRNFNTTFFLKLKSVK